MAYLHCVETLEKLFQPIVSAAKMLQPMLIPIDRWETAFSETISSQLLFNNQLSSLA